MFSNQEMQILSHMSRGTDTISELSGTMTISSPQTYTIVRSLKDKGAVHLDNGRVVPEREPYISTLMSILHDSKYSAVALSGIGMEIIGELSQPLTSSELSMALDVDKRTVLSGINRMMKIGMIAKEGKRYKINTELWPQLVKLSEEYRAHLRSSDERAPAGSRVYFRSKRLIVFSNDLIIGSRRTAFSVYGEYGVDIYLNTHYYCSLQEPLTIKDVMLHSMMVISEDKDWRLRMMALILYKKYRDEFTDIEHPMRDEMEKVLATTEGKVEGWVPLKEMQERAVMYEVDLYDN